MMPDFVIIGAMKCATSTLHDQLSSVSGISMSEPKEPNFFSDEQNWERGIGWYESLFELMPRSDLKGESSTHYTKRPTYPRCVDRMHEHLKHAKLIYVMRHPIERIVSQYIHEWSQRVIEKDCSIDTAIERYPMLVDYSRYSMQLLPFIERWGREAVLPVFFERLMRDPQPEFERIGRFLGIESPMVWDQESARNVSSERQRRSPLLDSILRNPAIQVLRRSILPENMRARLRSRWTMKERPELSPEATETLRAQLDPDLEVLGKWIGRDLTCENYREVILRHTPLEWASVEAA